MRLELSIRRTEKAPAVARRQRWTDTRGRLLAWSSGSPHRGSLEVAGTGVFRFDRDSNRVLAFVRPETDSARVEDSFRDLVYPLALQTRGWQALHASAVSTASGVVCLCGRSGAGKSTLARAWVADGGEAWADDTLVFRIGDREPETVSTAGDSRRLAAVVVLEPADAWGRGPDCFECLKPAAALNVLLPHALCLDAANADLLRGLFRAYADLVQALPVHRFRYRQGAREVPETVRRIARGVESSRAIR